MRQQHINIGSNTSISTRKIVAILENRLQRPALLKGAGLFFYFRVLGEKRGFCKNLMGVNWSILRVEQKYPLRKEFIKMIKENAVAQIWVGLTVSTIAF